MCFQNKFDVFLRRIETYVMASELDRKHFLFPSHDVKFSVELARSRGGSVAAMFSLINDDVSRIASLLYGRKTKFYLISQCLERIAPNGHIVGYSLIEYSKFDRLSFVEHIKSQAAPICASNLSLDMYCERVCDALHADSVRASDLPGTHLALTMAAFVAGREWREFADHAANSRSEAFNQTARRLKGLLENLSPA